MPRPPLEVGWVVAGRMHQLDLEASGRAREKVLAFLRTEFPEFDWRIPLIRQRDTVESPAEPVILLEQGSRERDFRQFDFVFVLTEADLQSYYKPYALGAPSKAMNVAVLSTAHIDPATGEESNAVSRTDILSQRIFALALHLFGHLNDLPHSDRSSDLMYDVRAVTDLDEMQDLSDRARRQLQHALREEADVRLEESRPWKGRALPFYLRALTLRGLDILKSVVRARPWLFPFRLSKLTTASVSALLVMLTTAEAWDLGMSQSQVFVAYFSALTLIGTVIYILKRQRLLIRRHDRNLSEQRVVSNVSTVISVLAGMTVTYILLFGGTMLIATTFFSRHLAESWAAVLTTEITLAHYFRLSGFVASLGLIIGALGASFESHFYFRHITYVDEET